MHEKYATDDEILHVGDIALIRMKQPIEFNAKVQPIKYSTKEVPSGSECKAFGWGRLVVRFH